MDGAIVRVFALAVVLVGCGDDGAGTVDEGTSDPSTSSATSAGTSTSSTTGPTTTSPTATSAPDIDTTTTSETTADESSSTGDSDLCGISIDPDQRGPWFEMRNANMPLVDGGTLALECGGQGLLMFYLRTTQGGFVPEGETVYYAVTLDVPGFDDLSPTGHFFQDLNAGVDVGCAAADEFEGGFSLDGVAVILPDALTEPAMVDGLPGTLQVEMEVPGGDPIVLGIAVTLDVAVELTPENCGFG